MSVDCFHSPAIECFPSTSNEVYTGLAYCNALAAQIVAANNQSYQNAFCTKSRCRASCCGDVSLADADQCESCDFSVIAKKYANSPNCLYGCCLDPYATSPPVGTWYPTNGSSCYQCSNSKSYSTTNAVWTAVRTFQKANYPKASAYYCT